jgi:hypothetical protein
MRTLNSATSVASNANALRSRLVQDGYLYLPGFLERAKVLQVQDKLRQALANAGWLTSSDGLRASRPDIGFTRESFSTVYPHVQQVEEFHSLAYDSKLWALTTGLLRGPIFCHPAKVARLAPPTAPGRGYFTRAHQDFVVQHVAADALTIWIPLTECDQERQGLRILPGSHHSGYLPTDPTLGGARPLYLKVDANDPRWATANYQLGDVVVFHSLAVHSGGPNHSDELRLSADVRHQRCDEPLRAEFAHPHGWPRTPDWPHLCAGWRSRRWIEVPPEVDLVPMPTGISYADFLHDLQAPPSRLLSETTRLWTRQPNRRSAPNTQGRTTSWA